MKITLVAALAHDRVIGRGNALPWHLPTDLAHFRRVTLGKPVVMGRLTFEAIGRVPLPKRRNVVLTRDPGFAAENVEVVRSVDEALLLLANEDEVMICGGAEVYAAFLPHADRMVLTFIDADIHGDTRFPPWDEAEWQETARQTAEADDRNAYDCAFVTLERRRVA